MKNGTHPPGVAKFRMDWTSKHTVTQINQDEEVYYLKVEAMIAGRQAKEQLDLQYLQQRRQFDLDFANLLLEDLREEMRYTSHGDSKRPCDVL